MKNLWSADDASAMVERYAKRGVDDDLALRTYSARLLGSDPALVLHGGGNTSVKTTTRDIFGDVVEVIRVKGSGWDLGAIEPEGHPAVRLAPLLRLRALDALSDEAMVNAQRQNLMDSTAPNPSVETLLHAFIPETFIDHTHALAILALADQPNAEELIADVFGDRVACVPYVMPGFALAKQAAAIWEASPGIEGLILLRHGVFTFGSTARESYDRMIALVSAAESRITRVKAGVSRGSKAPPSAKAPDVLPLVRGMLAAVADGDWPTHWILDHRASDAAMAVVDDDRLGEWSSRGVATPDHVIRMKARPLVLTSPGLSPGLAWREQGLSRARAFRQDYESYFKRQVGRFRGGKTPLDPLPRVILIPGFGLIGVGRDAGDAAVTADVAESWAATVLAAERVGTFSPIGEADTFDMEYWSLEQAKLGKSAERRLARHVVVVTGGAGAIGAAAARAFAAEGGQVVVLDIDGDAAMRVASGLGGRHLGVACDVRDPESVERAFSLVTARFGGVDIVVSNAGVAIGGDMATLPASALRASFDLNFFGHQNIAQQAVRVFRAQGMGGVLLFNVSKQALNPGADFGAYGTAKAALLSLMRQYALEHGSEGVRVNALNPDRIRSGLLTEAMIFSRSRARGVDAATYMAGNLLGEEVTAEDVAQAFVFAALMKRTTGAVITVDGGNVAAMVR